jgi:hypothetical protein
MSLLFGTAIVGLPLAHEFTGGPRAASWPALASSLISFLALVLAISGGAAWRADVPMVAALTARADPFLKLLAICLLVDGSIAWSLLRSNHKDAGAP